MKRRSFLKAGLALAGATLMPSTFFEVPKAATIDLSVFCEREVFALRYPLHLPFEQGDTTYATDGRICVRTKQLAPPIVAEEHRLPPVDSLPWEGERSEWKPLWLQREKKRSGALCPVLECSGGWIGTKRPCDHCHGGFIQTEEFVSNFSPEMCFSECPRCLGAEEIGEHRCDVCNGTGDVDWCYRLNNHRIAPNYISRIQTLEGVEIDTTVEHPDRPLRFRFNGGEGLVMGMHDD